MNKEEWFGNVPKLVIKTPATSANMGPGFDCLGMAVGLYNELWLKPLDEGATSVLTVEGYGEGEGETTDNLIYQTYADAMQQAGQSVKPVAMHCINRVPFARGLGSSSAAAVSGLAAAQLMSGGVFSKADLMQMATAIDGHPDNVLPALLGGIVIGCMDAHHQVVAQKLPPLKGLYAYALIPDYPLPTAKARAVMPAAYSREDVVHNLGHLGLLVAALATGNKETLCAAFSDRVHEPYRLPLMPGIETAKQMALDKGALAALVSGAGSTMLILSDAPQDFSGCVQALTEVGESGRLVEVPPIATGVQCYKDEMELELWP